LIKYSSLISTRLFLTRSHAQLF